MKSDSNPICGRCGGQTNDNALAVAREKELPESVRRQLGLCPTCIESFEQWYRRRGKSTSARDSRMRSKGSRQLPIAFRSRETRRRHRVRKQLQRLLMFTSVTILLFLVAFYWTWTILRTATRVEE